MLKKRSGVAISLMVAASTVAMGCGAHLYSPSARVVPMEAAKTLDEGQHAMGAHAGASSVDALEIFHAAARYRQGVAEGVEVGADVNLGVVTNMDEAATPVNPLIFSGRVATKWAPAALGDYFAVIGGLGGGTSEAGQFFSPDLGVIVAYENPYVVPFLSADGFVSVPINAHEIDMSSKDEGAGFNLQTPQTTFGV